MPQQDRNRTSVIMTKEVGCSLVGVSIFHGTKCILLIYVDLSKRVRKYRNLSEKGDHISHHHYILETSMV